MGDEILEGGMIEIGDPAEEPTALAPTPPHVVIEYRDRGVPWMLIPPLLALSAVAAILAYPRFAPMPVPRPQQARAFLPQVVEPPPPPPVISAPAPEAKPVPVEPLQPPEPVAAAPVEPTPFAELAQPTPAEPAPFPRAAGLGFDPKALEAARDPRPPGDPALTPAAGPDQPRVEPVPGATPAPAIAGNDQPGEVNPDLLPPDPRMARARRQRRAVETKMRIEADRGQFHAELRALCRKLGPRAAPEIVALCKKYDGEVPPEAKERAKRLLSVAAAGANRPVRINLLRSLGFPESQILRDLFDGQGKWEDGTARGGAETEEEVMIRAAQLLLNYPPNRAATTSRPVSRTRAER